MDVSTERGGGSTTYPIILNARRIGVLEVLKRLMSRAEDFESAMKRSFPLVAFALRITQCAFDEISTFLYDLNGLVERYISMWLYIVTY